VTAGRPRLVAAALAVGVLLAAAAARADGNPPLVGGDYYDTDCYGGHNLLKSDTVDFVLEREQLFAMHASGLNSLQYTINFTSDPSLLTGGHGGAILIGSDGGMIEPYRTRFIRYLTDAKDAGFTDITIAFYPYGPNSPQPWTTGANVNDWDPSLYGADWGFVQDVHDLTKQYGPTESHFDLMGEGPPSDYDRNNVGGLQIDAFIARLYSDYVTKYGNSDVFFNAIGYEHERLVHEIEDLKATGKPLPLWWGFDIQYSEAGAASDLAAADATLTAYGLAGFVALGETSYEDTAIAGVVQRYNAATSHPVVQVEEYPNWGTAQCIDAPYTGGAYLKVLGIQPGPLQASIDSKGRPKLTTQDGVPITALKAGQYTIVVADNSRKAGLQLTSLNFNRHTSAAYRGTTTWTVTFIPGFRYRAVGAPHTHPVSFVTLG